MIIRSAANLPERVRIVFEGPGRTRQSMTKECDINNIMARYQKTGALSHVNKHGASYGFATGFDFHAAMNVVKEGDRIFDDLPSQLRSRFQNPGEFLDFVQDEANAEEMIDLGLREPRAPNKTPEARSEEQPPAGVSAPPPTSEAAIAAAEASD